MGYTIAPCQEHHVPAVMDFIGECYRPGHVLSTSRALFDWQYRSDSDGAYNIAVAFDAAGPRILGILGYIESRRYDADLAADNCLWLALWQVRPAPGHPTLGPALMRFVRQRVEHQVVAVAGVRAGVDIVYRAMGFVVTQFRHYYMLNPDVTHHHIAVVPDPSGAVPPCLGGRLEEVSAQDFTARAETYRLGEDRVPKKSPTYFVNRYLRHPFYRYAVHRFMLDGVPRGLLATRMVVYEGHRVLRVVDTLLDPADVPAVGRPLLELVRATGAEYVDLLQSGLDDAALRVAGFSEVDPDRGVIVPDHFEPLARENSRLTLCFRAKDPSRTHGFVAFKGDGDQDRPNRL